MTDPNEKWVWGDEEDSSPQTLPLLDQKLTPIVEWPDLPPAAPSIPAESPEPPAVETKETPAPAIAQPAETEPEPEPVATAEALSPNGRSDTPPTVVKATMLHLEGQLEEAIQEIQTG